jgi:leucyl-tRNA synthetase
VYYVNGLPQMIDAQHFDYFTRSEKYLPTEGIPIRECCTNVKQMMRQTVSPIQEIKYDARLGGSSIYWMRYMDAKNEKEFAGQEEAYWEVLICILVETNTQTGHLLYSRFGINFKRQRLCAKPKNHSKN